MEILGHQTPHIGFATVINRQLIFVLGILLVAFVAVQFIILATLGTKGAEIADIRTQMDDLRISNEYLRSEIDKARTSGQIEPDIAAQFDIYPAEIQKVVVSTAQENNDAVSYNP